VFQLGGAPPAAPHFWRYHCIAVKFDEIEFGRAT